MGGLVILTGRTSTARPAGEVGLCRWACIFRRLGETVPGISSDLMTWVELSCATLEASGLDGPHKVYICTNVGGNRSDIQKGQGLWRCSRTSSDSLQLYSMKYWVL